jgi:hypothetical protein
LDIKLEALLFSGMDITQIPQESEAANNAKHIKKESKAADEAKRI